MATYVEPSRWNEQTKEADARRNKLREEVDKGAVSQRLKKMIGDDKYKKDEYDATNKLLNIKEEEKEALGQRIVDQYPKGTKSGTGQTSRNKAGYGKPVELPKYKEDSMTPGQKQSMEEAKDEETRKKTKTAPTTKTEMGKGFAKGGSASSRADGCAQRGKTRGMMV